MVGPLAGIDFMDDFAPYRLSGLVHGRAAAGDERVPGRQGIAFCQQTIGAGRWQPVILGDLVVRDLQAVRLFFEAIQVVRALAGLGVEQVASDIGEYQLFGVFIDKLVEAALATAVTEGFPF